MRFENRKYLNDGRFIYSTALLNITNWFDQQKKKHFMVTSTCDVRFKRIIYDHFELKCYASNKRLLVYCIEILCNFSVILFSILVHCFCAFLLDRTFASIPFVAASWQGDKYLVAWKGYDISLTSNSLALMNCAKTY